MRAWPNLLLLFFFFLIGLGSSSAAEPSEKRKDSLFALPDSSYFFDPADFDSRYTCPPCGCPADDLSFNQAGHCTECGMSLIQLPLGEQGQIARMISGLFRDSDINGLYYQKFMYPAYVLGLILGLVLVFSFRKSPGNFYLGLIFLSLSLYAFKSQLYGVSYGLSPDHNFLFFPISFITVVGPGLYLFARTQVRPEQEFVWKNTWHFLPAFFIFGMYLFLFFQDDHVKSGFLISPLDIGFAHYEQLLAVVQIIVYGYSGCRMVSASCSGQSDPLEISKYRWCQRLSWSLVGLAVTLGLLLWINFRYYNFGVSILTYYPLWMTIAILLYAAALQVLIQPQLVLPHLMPRKGSVNYTRNLDLQEIQDLKRKLLEVMDSRKPYLDPELSLGRLSQQVGIHAKDLTVVLNAGLNKNFYDFVNEYRVREVKQRLLDPKNRFYTNLAIAYESGFNSKSSFNALFKKYTRMTPSEYKKVARQRVDLPDTIKVNHEAYNQDH